jgi:hypothetical protein
MTPAEQHLGDRLAALIDGELGHDARERVLSHLATCWSCKAEADAQRRVKNVFADTAPPPPSDGLLARLQGLPACGPDGPGGSGERAGAVPGDSGASALTFDYLRGGRSQSALSSGRGFRIHEADRPASRGRRFAFAAAGAVSLAALALGGSLGSGAAGTPAAAKGDAGGTSASSVRTASSAANSDRDRRRRDTGAARSERGGGALSEASSGSVGASPMSAQDAVLLKGAPWAVPSAPSASSGRQEVVSPLLAEAFADAPLPRSALSPFSYGPTGPQAYAGEPRDAVPGGTPMATAPAPSPVVTAVPPQG